MALTSSYRRRTAGFTALFAALLLVLTALFAISPANAQQGAGSECSGDFVKIESQSETNTALSVPDYNFQSAQVDDIITITDGGDTVITITIDAVKDGGETTLLTVSLSAGADFTITNIVVKTGASNDADGGSLSPGQSEQVSAGASSVSHLTLCLGDLPEEPTEVTPEEPTFTDPTCQNNEIGLDVPADTESVTYTVSGDQEPGGTVIVTATANEGFVFPEGETTQEWEHTYGPLATDCDEPTEVTPDEPTFADPTCDVNSIGLDVPADTESVTYTVSGDQEPGGTVIVTATANEGFVFPEGETTQEWEHTFGEVPTNCGGVDESVVDPAAEVNVTCDAATIHLDNTASTQDKDVTYTITGVEGYDTVVVEAGTEQTIDIASTLTEDAAYDITVSAEGMDPVNAAGVYDCVDEPEETETPTETPTTDVSPDEVERPAPDPEPTPQPAAQAAAQDELPATGLGSTELLLLALLMLGLGAAALLGSDPRRQN